MKHILTLLVTIVIFTNSFAQNSINYKAVIKDDLGTIMANQTIDVRFSILQDGVEVYREAHATTTNDNGLIIVNIGEGTIGFGLFEDIDWGTSDHSLNVRINTGSGLVNLGTTPFGTVPYAISAANVTGLEAIDEGNGIGYRLVGRNPDNHGDLGLNAVDLSLNFTLSTDRGATGNYALATGFNTTASGTYSTAMGRSTVASAFNTIAIGNQATASSVGSISLGSFTTANGSNSTAIGSQTNASGNNSTAFGSQTTALGSYSTAMGRNTTAEAYSTAMGDGTEASGTYSTAMGRNTIASGNYSTTMGFNTTASSQAATAMGWETEASGDYSAAMGINNVASGNYSFAMGLNNTASGAASFAMGIATTAPSYTETVVGAYNTTYTPNSSSEWNSNDRLFVIGNGGDFVARSNAMVVLKNGNTGIGTSTPQELLHLSGGRLRIGSETIEDTGTNRLSFNADLLPDVTNTMQLGNSNFRWTGLWATDGTINTSDRRDKTNIKDLNYGLNEVLKMNPVSFKWKNRTHQDTKLGLIAQDLLKIIPEVVKTHEWQATSDDENALLKKVELDRLGVYYSDLIPVLINAIKEQQEEIKSLHSTIKSQDITNLEQTNTLEALLTRVNVLEQTNNQ